MHKRPIFGEKTNTKLTKTPTQATQAYNPQTQTPTELMEPVKQVGGYKRTMRPSPDENAYSTHRNSELRDNNDTSSQKTLLLQKTAQTPYKTVWKCRLKLLRIKRCSYWRLLKSLSSTFSLTKPDLSLLASMSMSGTPIRLWVSTF